VDDQRRRQFAYLATGEHDLLAWTDDNGIPLMRMEFVVPFVETDWVRRSGSECLHWKFVVPVAAVVDA